MKQTGVGAESKKANPEGLAFLLGDAGSSTWARTRDLRINSPTRSPGKLKNSKSFLGGYAAGRTYAERKW